MKLRNVSKGMHGPDVKAIQEGLNKYYGRTVLDPDGDFGDNTDRVVRQFQQERNLTVDGISGPVTRSVLFPLVGATVNFWARRRASSFTLGVPQLTLPPMPFIPSRMPPPGQPFPHLELTRPSLLGPAPSIPALDLNLPLSTTLTYPQTELIQPAGLPDAVPVPRVATPPGGRIVVDWQQLAQTQRQFTGLFRNPQDSFAIGWQSVFKRRQADPNARHLEIATGCLIQSPIGFQDAQGNDFTIACFAQATWVESLGQSGIFQWAPYVQVQGQANGTGPLNAMGSLGAFPLNFNFDLGAIGFDNVTLQAGAGVTGGLMFTPLGLRSTWGPTAGLGLTGKIWFLGN